MTWKPQFPKQYALIGLISLLTMNTLPGLTQGIPEVQLETDLIFTPKPATETPPQPCPIQPTQPAAPKQAEAAKPVEAPPVVTESEQPLWQSPPAPEPVKSVTTTYTQPSKPAEEPRSPAIAPVQPIVSTPPAKTVEPVVEAPPVTSEMLKALAKPSAPSVSRPSPQPDEQFFVNVANRWTATAGSDTPAVIQGYVSKDEQGYILGAGDHFSAMIPDLPEYANGFVDIMVDSAGKATLPPFGTYKVSGLTVGETTSMLREMAGYYLKHPRVSIKLTQMRPVTIYVTGEVDHPGAYPVGKEQATHQPRLTEILAKAGGVLPYANLSEVTIQNKQTGKTLCVDLSALMAAGDLNQDVLLEDGDTVIVSRQQTANQSEDLLASTLAKPGYTVRVFGWVDDHAKNATTLQLDARSMRLKTALSRAGVMPQANLHTVIIVHQGPNGQTTQRVVNAWKEDSRLEDNDVVIVPHRKGVYRLQQGLGTFGAVLFGSLNAN